jgi:CPA1 family monovalent cation:H+ antiporter
MHLALLWGWLGSALFGALIAATDPVSVIAAFKELRVEPRLGLLVESESLLNDGAAAVAFSILTAHAGGAATGPGSWAVHPGGVAAGFLWMVLGGAAIGAAVAGALLVLAGRTDDHLVEITLTTIAAYGAYLLAEHLHMSGVLASLAAGLVIGNVGWRGPLTEQGRSHMVSFWEYAAFLANSVVFILIGGHEAHEARHLFTAAALIAICLVLAGRALAVYPLCALFRRSRFRVAGSYQHVLVWGGLRGALGLALALAVPAEVPERSAIVLAAFATVTFSIFAQGITMPWMIRALRLRADQAPIARRAGGNAA